MVFVAFDEDMKLLLFILIIQLEFYAGELRLDKRINVIIKGLKTSKNSLEMEYEHPRI